jgi:Immunoglobulin-like domain of bacterial spore germination
MTSPTDLETRVQAALTGEARTVEPTGDSLATIRRRARAAHRRRRTALAGAGAAALVAVVVAVPLVGDDDPDVTTRSNTPSTSEAPDPTTPTTTEAPDPASSVDAALWPDPAGDLFDDPVDAVRSFVTEVVGIDDPPLSDYLEAEPGAGEVDVLPRGEDGTVLDGAAATVAVRQLDGEHWFVTAASSEDVQIDDPEPGAEVASPVPVAGRGRGFEGNILVDLRARSAGAGAIGSAAPAIAGAGQDLAPFSVEVPFDFSPSPVAIVVARNTSGADLAVPGFSAVGVRLAAGPGPGTTDTPSGTPTDAFRYQPLWPFASQAEADQWLREGLPGGHQPWHASAEATAQFFTQNYLGFGEIDRITSADVGATEAWIGVGYESEPGFESTSAVVHLVRFGSDPQAPWEVVGTRDTDLTLEAPDYGSTLSSPVTVGGEITGVDESLQVQVHQISSTEPLGTACCLPAGGDASPWEMTVELSGPATDPAVTVVVFTGGHVQDVERFAITGLRT